MNLLLESKKIKREATSLLNKSDLLNYLQSYGQLSLRGSYFLDLMIDGDIDLLLINKRVTKKLALKILKGLIEKNFFRGYLFYDFTKRRSSGLPLGYYIGLKTHFKKRKWKIDLWLCSKIISKRESFINSLNKKLTNDDRKNILAIKKEVKRRNLDIKSYIIYQAYIKGITSFSAFWRFWQDKNKSFKI